MSKTLFITGASTGIGAATARAAARLSIDLDLPLPVCSVVADLSQGRLTVRQAMDTLLSRPLKDE